MSDKCKNCKYIKLNPIMPMGGGELGFCLKLKTQIRFDRGKFNYTNFGCRYIQQRDKNVLLSDQNQLKNGKIQNVSQTKKCLDKEDVFKLYLKGLY